MQNFVYKVLKQEPTLTQEEVEHALNLRLKGYEVFEFTGDSVDVAFIIDLVKAIRFGELS